MLTAKMTITTGDGTVIEATGSLDKDAPLKLPIIGMPTSIRGTITDISEEDKAIVQSAKECRVTFDHMDFSYALKIDDTDAWTFTAIDTSERGY
jgi:hypothetical protein